ncbi:hypothetical protein D9M69_643200 [compost metagenome]
MPLPTGGQLLTSGSGSVTVQFASGCTAILAPGQSMPVTEAACQQNVAARAAGGGAGGSGGGVFAGGNGLLLAGGGVAALAYNVNQNRKGNGANVITNPGSPAVVVTPTPPRRPISRS